MTILLAVSPTWNIEHFSQRTILDLTLVCSDGQLKAHKIILAVVSDYVARESCMSNEVHIPKLGTSYLQKMIKYIYRQFYGPFESNEDVTDFVKGVEVLKIRMLDATVASLKEGIQHGKSYKSYCIAGTELQSPDLLRSAMAAHVTPQASDLDDDALMGTDLKKNVFFIILK